MSDFKRVIPCLDVKDGRLVKGVNFEQLVDIGDPVEVGRLYSEAGADELVFLDISATVEERKTMVDLVRMVADAVSIPLTAGGGVSALSDIERLLDAGVSKVSINTAAVKEPELVYKAAKEFGEDKIVVALDTKRNDKIKGGFEVLISGGRLETGISLIDLVKKVQDNGAAELLPTSKDADGTRAGYDIPMLKTVVGVSGIPVIASGGAGSLEDLYNVIVETGVDAVLVASLFHFGKVTVEETKNYLKERGIKVRL